MSEEIMNIESFINTLSSEQQQTAFNLLWQKFHDAPQTFASPDWHGDVLAYREANPSSAPKMNILAAKTDVKRMIDERRNS